MVYYKKTRKTTKWRRPRRTTFSKYGTYRYRSSASQARQIYLLNKKINAIMKRTKPEVNIAPLISRTFSSDSGTAVSASTNVKYFGPVELTNLVGQDSAGVNGFARVEGRFARIQNITVKGTFTYLKSDAGQIGAVDLQRQPAYARVVIYQTKTSRETSLGLEIFSITTAGTVKDSTNSDGTALGNYALMRAPLSLGLARKCKIMSDKLYMISDTKQAINIKTKLKYVKNWYLAPNENAPKGNVMMMVLLYNTSANSEEEDIVDASECQLNVVSKCVYTDA